MSLADLSATELRRRISAREVTVVQSVEACLERVKQHNETLNAIVTLNPRALDDAAQLDRRIRKGDDPGPLCGLTVGIKDVTAVGGLRTTYGSPMYADNVPEEDALVVRRLREAGAVILGKTNCPEFAAGRTRSMRSRTDPESIEPTKAPARSQAVVRRRWPPA